MDTSEFDELRPLLFSIAYRMLSSVADAEDIVQDAFLRYQRARSEGTTIESPKAYLSATVTRLSIDQLRSARQRREVYAGNWLPEPILTDEADPSRVVERSDTLSAAFLLVLERLSPVERAVFLLHDVFVYDYDEVAKIVDKTPVNCRKLATRARRHVEANRPRVEMSSRARHELAESFFMAMTAGDLDGLVKLLAEDVAVYGDGGGKAPQWTRPITGVERVSRLMLGLMRQLAQLGGSVEPREINGQPGFLFRDAASRIISVFMLDIEDGAVQVVRSVINPDKLQHLGPVADIWSLIRQMRES